MTSQGCRGFTLIELLVVVAIAIILLLYSIPSTSMAHQSKADTTAQMLLRITQLAKQRAINEGGQVTLCGTANLSDCDRLWHNMTIMVFADKNNNHRRDSDENILDQAEAGDILIQWNGVRPYMRFRPDGTAIEFGTYTYCPINRDNHLARQLTINAAGRPYLSTDQDHDGFHENNTTGGIIDCSLI